MYLWDAFNFEDASSPFTSSLMQILLSPQSCLNKELGQLQSRFSNRFTTAATEHSGNLFFLYLWGFYRGFLLRGVVISQVVSNSQDRSSRASTLCYSKKERRKATGLEEPFLAALGSLRFGAHAFQTHLALHARLGSPNEPAQSECCHLTCARRAFCLSKQNHGYTISITYQAFRFLASHPCGAQPPIQKRTHSILGSGHKNPVPDIS